MSIISEVSERAWLCVFNAHLPMGVIKSDCHGNGAKPLFWHKEPSKVTFTVLTADVLFRSLQRRRLKNKLPPEKAHLLLQHVTS